MLGANSKFEIVEHREILELNDGRVNRGSIVFPLPSIAVLLLALVPDVKHLHQEHLNALECVSHGCGMKCGEVSDRPVGRAIELTMQRRCKERQFASEPVHFGAVNDAHGNLIENIRNFHAFLLE